jgi:hypothetical protein
VGAVLPVKIAIVPHRDFGSLRAHFETHDGLALNSGENFGPVTGVDAETALQHELVLLPGKEGVFMVSVSVETDGEDGNFTRVFTIPVIVGMAQAQPSSPAPAAAKPPQPAAN